MSPQTSPVPTRSPALAALRGVGGPAVQGEPGRHAGRDLSADPVSGARAVLGAARHGHPGLFWFAAALGVLAAVCAVGLVVDDRVVLSAPLWAKPLKFALSFGFYAFTLAWMLSYVRRGRRVGTAVGWLVVTALATETVILTFQAARGRRSHFNLDTPLDAQLSSIMGLGALALWVLTLALAVALLVQRIPDRSVAWSIRLGLLVTLVGMGVGILMARPSGGAHSVGVPDGGPGLPLTGWSTVGGDLRVGHFIGIHALQVLPLLAAVLTGVVQLTERARLHLVVVAAAGYLGLVVLLTWQALRGQPLFAPDATTLVAAALLVLAVGAGATAVVVGGRRPAG